MIISLLIKVKKQESRVHDESDISIYRENSLFIIKNVSSFLIHFLPLATFFKYLNCVYYLAAQIAQYMVHIYFL